MAQRREQGLKNVPPGTKEILYQRSRGRCEKCGQKITLSSGVIHHRKLRSRGGTHDLSNLVILDATCHNLGTGSVHLDPAKATEQGFLVASWDDPAQVPIRTADNALMLLLMDGTYERTEHSGFLGDSG